MSWFNIINNALPARTLVKRTLPSKGKEFKTFFEKPQNRSFEDKVRFVVWMQEILQSGKLDIWDELREAGFSKDIRHEFSRIDLTPEQMVAMTEVFVFPDQFERNKIRTHASNTLYVRNERRMGYFQSQPLEDLERETQSTVI